MNVDQSTSYAFELTLPKGGLTLRTAEKMTSTEFAAYCTENPDLVLELEPDGTITIMSPIETDSGEREAEVITDLKLYARKTEGRAYSSSTGFTLPDGSVRSPDGSYVTERQRSLVDPEQLKGFAHLVPEFIVEVMSPTDRFKAADEKMRETWMANGTKLAWLINTEDDKLWIYREDGSVELVTPLTRTITGEHVLPGFEFDLTILT